VNRLSAIIIGILIAYIIFLQQCSKCPTCPEVPETKTRIDTVFREQKDRVKETIKPEPVKTIEHDFSGVAVVDSAKKFLSDDGKSKLDSMLSCNDINIYSDTLEDSTGRVIVGDSIRGTLLKQTIHWKPKISYIKETKEVFKPVPQRGLFVGAGIVSNFSNGFSVVDIEPGIDYTTRNGYSYGYGYSIFLKNHEFSIKKNLFNKK
jgi:hypothetical protein